MIVCLCLLMVLGGGGYLAIQLFQSQKTMIVSKSVKELNEELEKVSTVMLSGKVEPKAVSKHFLSQERGKVASVDVNEGDEVKKGQKLFTYSNPEGDLAMREAELAVRSENSSLEQKRTELNQKYTQIQNKKNKLQKTTRQYQQADAETKGSLESDKSTLEEEVNQIQSDINNLVNEVNAAELSLEKAQASYELSKQKYENKEVVSEIDGIIKKIDRDQIEKTMSQNGTATAFMEIYDTSEFFVSGKVSEFQKEKLQSLPQASFVDRNNEDNKWTGKFEKIEEIGDSSESEDGGSSMTKYKYRAKVDPTEQPPTIGKHVFVVAHSEEPNHLLVPKEMAIKEKGEYYVWKVVGKKIRKSKIEIEKEDQAHLLIKAGLTQEDKIVFPLNGLKEGMEVGQYIKT